MTLYDKLSEAHAAPIGADGELLLSAAAIDSIEPRLEGAMPWLPAMSEPEVQNAG